MSWDLNTAATTCPYRINLVVWSPCSGFVAVTLSSGGLDTMAIGILDSVTFQQLQTLEFPQTISKSSRALSFSPDGCILTCFSQGYKGCFNGELFVVSWDLQTGGVASIIRWQAPEQSVVGNPSITYSANGKIVGILHQHCGGANIFICDVASGVYMHSHPLSSDIPLSKGIWTHGESLQFATADTTTITIWAVEFISAGAPKKVETLPAPDNFNPTMFLHADNPNHTGVQILPTPYLLVLISLGKVLLWDMRNSRCLLDCTDIGLYPATSFSSDGCFFACSTIDGVSLWKKSPSGYILHTTLQLGALRYPPNPLLSQNGELFAVSYDCTIRLWHTNSFTTSPPSVSAQAPTSPEDFILDFSPDGTLAVIAMNNDNTVTVLNLKSGIPQLTISTDVWVRGLRVIGSTVVVIGYQGVWKVVTWDLSAKGCVSGTRVDLEDSSWTINLEDTMGILSGSQGAQNYLIGASISPDSHYIAITTVTTQECEDTLNHLCIYSVSTGEHLGHQLKQGKYTLWFAPDGCNLWCAVNSGETEVWRVGGQDVLECLDLTVDLDHPPEGYPWASSKGYQVTDDWWILGPDGKRLLMLPPPWQSYTVQRRWNGQFLALLHEGLSEAVILELEP